MTNPKITVVMAVYNGAKYIRESIQCVLEQTFTDFELLILNDGSTDNSMEVVAEFKDPRIRILHNEKNSGILFTRNRGLQEAFGKYVAVLDCDDLCSPNRLELQFQYLEANSDVAVCGTWGIMIDENNTVFGHQIMPEIHKDRVAIQMLFTNQFIHSSVVYHKDIALKVGGYTAVNGCEDYGLFSRISIEHKMANLPEFLTKYREHSQGISKTKVDSIRVGEKQILDFLYQRFAINEELLEVPFAYIKNEYLELQPEQINTYFTTMLAQNKTKKIFQESDFQAVFFEKWYDWTKNNQSKVCAKVIYKTAKMYHYHWSQKQKRKLFKLRFNPFI